MNSEKVDFSKRELNHFILLIQTFFHSAKYQIWLGRNNFAKIKSLHNLIENDEVFEYSPKQKRLILQITQAISFVEKYAPWKPKCYNLAMVARRFLKKYQIPNKLEIGFRKRDNKLMGHAWVHCNNKVVSGYIKELQTYNRLKPVRQS